MIGVCKFCGCTDAKACAIPMTFGVHPLSRGSSQFDYEELPIIAFGSQVVAFTTPCHWSAPDICSAPACVDRAYPEAVTLMEQMYQLEAA